MRNNSYFPLSYPLAGLLSASGVKSVGHLRLAGNAMYTSPTARDDMLDALFSVVNAETLRLVQQASFVGVMVDETTDVSNLGQMVIHLRCVSAGSISTRLGGLCQIAQRDAPSLKVALEEKLAALNLDWKKCHIASDGASVFTGRLNGVSVRLIRDHGMQQSLAIHCVCHREALAAADAVKAVTYLDHTVKPTIAGVYRLFDNSGVKEASLHAFQDQLQLPALKLKEPKDVRWLSYEAAINVFRKTFPAILLELKHQQDDQRDAAAKAWVKRMKTFEFVASLHLLSDALPLLASLSRKFQSATLNFAQLEPALNATITSIELLKEQPGAHYAATDDFLQKLRTDDAATDIIIPVTEAKRQAFDRNVRKRYLQALIDCLRQRFPAMPIISALGILDTRNFPARNEVPAYGNDKLDLLLTRLAAPDMEDRAVKIDADEARSEWLRLKAAILTHPNLMASKGVPQIVKILVEQHAGDFPNICSLADWGLAICLSTAECERDFSLLKLVKTARRNNLSTATLEKLMAIKLDAGSVDNYPFEAAMTRWLDASQRRTRTASATPAERAEV